MADSLIEHNGIISERLAGTIRYLDSDPEEQRRGITMRSSAIGLSHQFQAPPGKKTSAENGPHIIHLVDSPGHTDFSWEVSSALTACDACLLVVDAVEGMGPRTHQVFREALINQLVPVLVINKMDRLCTDLGLTPTEAYLRTRTLLESVNAAASAMITSLHQQQQQQQQSPINSTSNTAITTNTDAATAQEQQEAEEMLWTFDPSKGNVVFCSALFGWGFTSASLARSLFQRKIIPMKPVMLRPYIFGDFKYSVDSGKVLKWKPSSGDAPLFAEYGLQPLWDIYQGVATAANAVGLESSLFATGVGPQSYANDNKANNNNTKIKADTPGMEQVLEAMQVGATCEKSLQVATLEDMKSVLTKTGANTEESILRSLLRRYRSLAPTVLDVVCEYCPAPQQGPAEGVMVRSKPMLLQAPTEQSADFSEIQTAVQTCDIRDNAPCVAYVCKFFSSDRSHIRDPTISTNTTNGDNKESSNVILGLTRVLSGKLKTGNEYYLFGPKHTESSPPPPQKAIRLYLLMGSSFVLVDEVPAGHLCAVLNLEDVQLKNITLSDRPNCMPLSIAGDKSRMRPLVKVNVEAKQSSDMEELDRGLLKLSLADAAVEVTATARGERILACLGEIHLEQSILDLKHVYCSGEIELRTSDPIVDFGETTTWFPSEVEDYRAFYNDKSPQPQQATMPPFNEEPGLAGANHGRARSLISGNSAALRIRVVPLAESVYQSLQMKRIAVSEGDSTDEIEKDLQKLARSLGFVAADNTLKPDEVLNLLLDCLCSVGANGTILMESPNLRNGSTIFGVESNQVYVQSSVDAVEDADQNEDNELEATISAGKQEFESLNACIRDWAKSNELKRVDNAGLDESALSVWKKIRGSTVAGFQLAVRSGPFCEEPVRNVLVLLEGLEIALKKSNDDRLEPAKPLSGGMIASALRSGIRCALLTRPARLMEGYLRLTLNSSLNGLGSLYSVLSKRRGKVEDDSMVDGTDLLAITALIPQAEAFGLAPELFAKTSGEVTAPEMMFSHWETLDVDPFWIPRTEEEREDYGELQNAGDSSTGLDNTALNYIRKVRERKGLKVDSTRTVVAAEKQRTMKR